MTTTHVKRKWSQITKRIRQTRDSVQHSVGVMKSNPSLDPHRESLTIATQETVILAVADEQ